jgi:hypothetical protein
MGPSFVQLSRHVSSLRNSAQQYRATFEIEVSPMRNSGTQLCTALAIQVSSLHNSATLHRATFEIEVSPLRHSGTQLRATIEIESDFRAIMRHYIAQLEILAMRNSVTQS